jgi:4a-hydroxytetrahydrobiopterin dehydratase
MLDPLTTEEIADALATLPGWAHVDDRLTKTFQFESFREALGFLLRVGLEAEALNHHPEIRNTYSRVSLALQTHDAGDRVTARDVALARAVARLVPP